jgi:outer membrane protein TolC
MSNNAAGYSAWHFRNPVSHSKEVNILKPARTHQATPFPSVFKPLALAAALLALTGCASIAPTPLVAKDLLTSNQADRQAMRRDVQAITGPLTLDEALARALKYNLDRRSKLMEEALALNQLEVSHYDMLPKLMAQAGYATRSNDKISLSRDELTGTPSTSRFLSQDRSHNLLELGFTWNLLDYGLGYYGAHQQAHRVLIASEKRRKAMHILMQDVRTVYWRAASAQKLRSEVEGTIAVAEEALADSRKAEAERVRSPLDALRYQRQLLENLRLLEAIDQELSAAQVELATLINAPLGQTIQIADADLKNVDASVLDVPLQVMEEAALAQNADLREQHYNTRVAREETRKTMVRLFPNLTFNYGIKYDSDNYLVNRNWNEAGLQLSFNLFNVLTGPTQLKLAEAGVKLADQRRMSTQLAVLSQVHLARLQLLNARKQFERADTIYSADVKIAEIVRNRAAAQAQSKLDSVSNATSAILSLLRRYQALAQVQAAEQRLLASLGLDQQIGSTGELSLTQLTEQIKRNGDPWTVLQKPAPTQPKVAP